LARYNKGEHEKGYEGYVIGCVRVFSIKGKGELYVVARHYS